MFPNSNAHGTGMEFKGMTQTELQRAQWWRHLALVVRRQEGTWWQTGSSALPEAAADGQHGVPWVVFVTSCFSQPSVCPGFYLSHTSPLFLLFSIRWQQTSKSSGLSSSLQPAGAKADALREEMEEAANRVEICRVPLFAPLSWDRRAALRESFFSLECYWNLRVSLCLTSRPQACLLASPKSQGWVRSVGALMGQWWVITVFLVAGKEEMTSGSAWSFCKSWAAANSF